MLFDFEREPTENKIRELILFYGLVSYKHPVGGRFGTLEV